MAALAGKVALVTGASRGIGRGIALQLGSAGAKVYVTGRQPSNYDANTKALGISTSLDEVAAEISKRGGNGVRVFCDHSDPKSVEKLFEQIKTENNGQLDILVNNAYAGVTYIMGNMRTKFYELDPVDSYDSINNVGLRNHYICASHAARLMVPRKSGLIVTVSSSGGMGYLFNTAYGLGKAACDRLAADIAVDLVDANITSVSLWPGPVKTEIVDKLILSDAKNPSNAIFGHGETTEFSGQCIVALASDPKAIESTANILTTSALARKYNIKDSDGSQPITVPRIEEYVEFINKIRNVKDYRLNASI
uniref:Dehydrogenase/reductase SDR family member 1 n=1 Tax=Panagrellus redivivus TaxID=6233 RepID=A0A7E4VJ71_PANRE